MHSPSESKENYTFIPYCNFATMGLSDMKVKSFLLQVNGKGTMSSMKMVISATSRRNTYARRSVSMICSHRAKRTEGLGGDRSIDE